MAGTGSLDSISGTLAKTNSISTGNLFQIYISDPTAFSASTPLGLSVNTFDTQLFLFNNSGLGIVANDDDTSTGAAQARISAGSNALSSLSSGTYYLLIEGGGRYAISSGGLIFPNYNDGTTAATSLVSATGAGAGSALSGATGNSNEGGAYRIALTGAQFVPEPSALLLLAGAGAFLVGARRRKSLAVLAVFLGLALDSSKLQAADEDAPANLGLGLRELAQSVGTVRPASATRSEDTVRTETRQKAAAFSHAQLDAQDRILVEIHLDGSRTPAQVRALLASLKGRPVTTIDWYRKGMISAWIAPKHLARLATSRGVSTVQMALPPIKRIGKTSTQGVTVHKTTAVNASGYKGANISIGVLSDSYNKDTADASDPGWTTASKDVTNGDLPGTGNPNGYLTPVSVISEAAASSSNTDEGRAMMQIIHDIAPASKLAFATSGNDLATFAANIKALQTAGCQVICDDIGFLSEPMFSDGVVAQAVDAVAAKGVAYFSAYGNDGNNGYAADFSPVSASVGSTRATAGGVNYAGLSTTIKNSIYQWHSFGTDSSGNPIVVQTIKTGADVVTPILQWDDPFDVTNGITCDYDLLIFNSAGNYLSTRSSLDNNITTQEPIEMPGTDLAASTTYKICIVLTTRTGTKPRAATHLRYAALTGDSITGDYITTSNVEGYGHPSSALGNGVAAYNYDIAPDSTNANHVYTPGVETFSSNGPSRIFFDSAGNRLATSINRKQPVFSAVDNVNTSFFPPDTATPNSNDYDDDGYPNFAGTSAATPHAAAIAALLMNAAAVNSKGTLTPGAIRNLMSATTQGQIDQDPSFSHADSGPVTITAAGESATDSSAFKVTFKGTAGQQLTKVVINLTGTGLHFDTDATNGFPFTTGTTTGSAAISGTPTLTGGTSGKAIATINFTSFDPGDTLTFGVDRDRDGSNAYGNSADELAGGTVTATISSDGSSPYTGSFVNALSRAWNFKAGYGLLDAQAAVNLLLSTQ